jgi:hypothetical protein
VRLAKLRSVLFLGMSTSVLLVGQFGTSVFAATKGSATNTSNAINNNANSLKLSPLRTDITVKAGDSTTVKTYVTNVTTQAVVLKPIENDFVAGDEKGTPSLILDENSYAPTHSLKRFMQPLSNITIAAGASAEVDVKVVVPKTAQAGGYYGAIRFTPAANGSQTVQLNSSVASLILLTVPGPAVERLTLTNFNVQQNGGSASNFRTPKDLSLFLRFENKGNLQEGPFGQIYVQKGKKVLYTSNFNQTQPRQVILPDSARRWNIPLKGFGKFGKYTVGGTFTYGNKGESIQITKTVWIVPTAVIMAIVIAVVVIAILVLGLWLFLRNYKRRILKSSRRRY